MLYYIGMESRKQTCPNVFEYIDYRLYLMDLYMVLSTSDANFSQRAFARLAGSTSPNYLQLILKRKLNISASAIASLHKALHYTQKEREYFETLVFFDHAKTHYEKDHHFRILLKTREYRTVKKLEQSQYEYFSHWYYPVIREMVVHPLFKGDLQWIAEKISPQLTVAKVKKSIETLINLGLISYNTDNNNYLISNNVVSTPAEVISLAVIQYHRDCIRLAAESIESFGPELRDLRSVTLGVSEQGFADIRQRLEAFWKELLDFSETQKDIHRVIQINLQAFPLTADLREGNDEKQ